MVRLAVIYREYVVERELKQLSFGSKFVLPFLLQGNWFWLCKILLYTNALELYALFRITNKAANFL